MFSCLQRSMILSKFDWCYGFDQRVGSLIPLLMLITDKMNSLEIDVLDLVPYIVQTPTFEW